MDNGASSCRRFLDGDDNGLEEIVRNYNDGLVLYLNSFVGNIAVADELSEDVFVKLGIRRPRFKGKSSFKTWLYAIGRNVALDYIRKASNYNVSSLDDGVEQVDEDILEKTFLKEEQKIIIHKAMSRLKPEYRQVLWLIYFEEFSHRETAKIMKKTVHNIETLAYRARQSLKSVLEKEGFVYENL